MLISRRGYNWNNVLLPGWWTEPITGWAFWEGLLPGFYGM